MKKTTGIVNGILVISRLSIVGILVFGMMSCGPSYEDKKAEANKKRAEKIAPTIKEIKDLVARWNADDGWEAKITINGLMGLVLTSRVQEVLKGDKKNPIFVLLSVKDIIRQDNGSYAGYFVSQSGHTIHRLLFKVVLSDEQYNYLTRTALFDMGGYSAETFALIIRVLDVHASINYSARVEDTGVEASNDESSKYESHIEENFSPLVIGECLALVSTPGIQSEDLKK